MLGQAGDREGPGDRAEREHELVVLEHELLAVDALHGDGPAIGVDRGHAPHEQIGARQLGAQWHDHVAAVEDCSRGRRQEGRVEQEVRVVDEGDPRAVRRNDVFERPRGVETAEPPTRDDDAPGHAHKV